MTIALINHLYKNYACVSATDMTANNNQLRLIYNPENPLESLIKQLNKCAGFAVAEIKPFTETQIVQIAYVLVVEIGIYQEYYRM